MNENYTNELSQVFSCKFGSLSHVLYLSSIVINFIFVAWLAMTELLPKLKNAANRFSATPLSITPDAPNTEDIANQVLKSPQLPSWNCAGASVVGISHLRGDKPCQDYHTHTFLPNGSLCLAIADGTGSASYADIGAKIACDTMIQYLSHQLSAEAKSEVLDYEQWLRQGFEQAHRNIADTATKKGMLARDYATTLIGVIVTPTFVVAGMVGDGMVILKSLDGVYKCIFGLPEREYANQMHSITSKRYKSYLQVAIESSPIVAVAICTDGIQGVSCDLSKNTPYPPFFDNVFQVFEIAKDEITANDILADYLQHPIFNELTDDDKTLVMAKRITAGETRPSKEPIGNAD